MRFSFVALIAMIIICVSCSHGGDPVSPDAGTGLTPQAVQTGTGAGTSHYMWGLWQFNADPDAGTLDVTELRTAGMHVNVLPFLEPPAGVRLKISNISFDGLVCDVDVHLVHPFPGLSQYTGFDVAGILISSGNWGGFSDSDLILEMDGDTRLLNPDGYTRWWNPSEFAIFGQPILRYRDGLLGNKYTDAHFDATLNGYKLFSDSLEPDDAVTDLDPSDRLVFSHGVTNTRHYTIDFEGGVVFNYAVDANWEPPAGIDPYEIDDFPAEANRAEAWAITVTEEENSLWYEGGESGGGLKLLANVWDHFNAGENLLWIESPGNFNPAASATPVAGGEGFSTYYVEVSDATPKGGSIDILIGIESEVIGYWDVLPDTPISAYFTYTAQVGGQQAEGPVAIMEATSPTDISEDETVSFDASASTGTPPLTFEWDFNGDDVYDGPEDAYDGDPETPTHEFDSVGTFMVTVKVTNSVGFDISDPVAVYVGYDPLDIFVDGDYTGGDSDGTMSKPFLMVQEGMNAVTSGHKVHVDYLDGADNTYWTNGLTLKSNVVFTGDNWNGGGPGKPKLDNDAGTYTVGTSSNISNFTIERFEVGIAEMTGNLSNYGINMGNWSGNLSYITVRHCNITDYVDDTGKDSGPGIPINMNGCDYSQVEFNDIGPITWESETPGVYARVLWGMYFQYCDNTEVKNNFIHDITIDYDGQAGYWGQIRMFCLHCYASNGIDVHNNLICHVKGVNDYDYRIEGMMMEGYSTPGAYYYYNNTIDNLDHSQSNGGFMLRGIFIYTDSGQDSYINNTIISYFKSAGSMSPQVYFSSPVNMYEITYSTGYSLAPATDYFYNLIEGDGCVNYPGIDPKYVNNTTSPYDYTFQDGSGCEMGDPDFIDWDDTGAPSGDPDEPSIENRSRMGCFGGPDGEWDPYDL